MTAFTTIQVDRMHAGIKNRICKSAGNRRIDMTLTAFRLRRNMSDLFRYRTGCDIRAGMTGRAIIGDTAVIKHATGKISGRRRRESRQTRRMADDTVLISRCRRDMIGKR